MSNSIATSQVPLQICLVSTCLLCQASSWQSPCMKLLSGMGSSPSCLSRRSADMMSTGQTSKQAWLKVISTIITLTVLRHGLHSASGDSLKDEAISHPESPSSQGYPSHWLSFLLPFLLLLWSSAGVTSPTKTLLLSRKLRRYLDGQTSCVMYSVDIDVCNYWKTHTERQPLFKGTKVKKLYF